MPNIAIADELKKNGATILYIGSQKKMDRELVQRANIKFKAIYAGKLRRYFTLQNLVDIFKIPIGFFQSIYFIGKFKPDVIFSKGGYVAVPVVFAGALLRKKIVIHESDSNPGLTTKITANFADKVLVAYEETVKLFNRRKRKKVIYVGSPIRAEMLYGNKKDGYKLTGFSGEKPVILAMGGSLGATKINNTLWSAMTRLIPKYQIVHICGQGKSGKVLSNFLLDKLQESYIEFEYAGEELADIYAVTDLIISRAGANSLAEIEALGVPAIIVPLPSKYTRGDQEENAKCFRRKDKRRYKIIKNENFTSKRLIDAIEELSKFKKRPTRKEEYAAPARKIAKTLMDYEDRS